MKLLIDGKLHNIAPTKDGTSHGYQGIHVINNNGQPVARHTVPKDWFKNDSRYVVRTGGHTYQHHGVWSRW